MRSTLALALSAVALAGTVSAGAAQSWSDMQIARAVQGEESLEVHVKYGAGRFNLRAVDAPHLYRMRMRFDEDSFEPLHEYRRGRLEVGVSGNQRWNSSLRLADSEAELELALSRGVPIDLRLELGAVVTEIDLGGLQLTALDMALGASESRIRVSQRNPLILSRASLKVGAASFTATELGNLNAREILVEAGVGEVKLDLEGLTLRESELHAKMGLGSLEVRIPSNVGIEVQRSTFLASVNAPGLSRRGNTFYSENWDSAEIRLRIRLESVLGSVTIIRP